MANVIVFRIEREPAASADYVLALLATAFVAAIPQFLFISASFTNDTLVITACAAAVYWLARLLARQAARDVFNRVTSREADHSTEEGRE